MTGLSGLPALPSPATGVQQNGLTDLLQLAVQYPQLKAQAQQDKAARDTAMATAQNAQRDQAVKALQQLQAIGRINPAIQKSPGWLAAVKQNEQRLGASGIPMMNTPQPTQNAQSGTATQGAQTASPTAQPPQNFTQPTPQGMAQMPPAAPQQPVGYGPLSQQRQLQGAGSTPQFGPPGALAANSPSILGASAQAAAAPQQEVDLNALVPGLADPSSDVDTMQKVMTLPPGDARRYWAQKNNVNLPDSIVNAPIPLGAGEKIALMNGFRDEVNKLSSGASTPEAFLGYADAMKGKFGQDGIGDISTAMRSSGALDKISAQGQAHIQELESKGLLTKAQAKAMLAKLPGEVASINDLNKLHEVQAKYTGERAAAYPAEEAERVRGMQARTQAVVQNATTNAGRLALSMREFQQTGGVGGKRGMQAYQIVTKQAAELRSNANVLRAQMEAARSASNDYYNKNLTTNPDLEKIYDQANGAYQAAAKAAETADSDAQMALNHTLTQTGMGNVTDVQPAGNTGLDTGLLARFKSASASDKQATLNDPSFSSLSPATQAAMRASAR